VANDQEKLAEVLNNTSIILAYVIHEQRKIFPELLFPHIEAAWHEVHINIELLKSSVLNATPYKIKKLERVGLTGTQGELKYTGFTNDYREWKINRTIKLLKKLFKWMNMYLGSLSKVFIMADLIKEFKDIVDITVDEIKD
jgi:hypothetical protein